MGLDLTQDYTHFSIEQMRATLVTMTSEFTSEASAGEGQTTAPPGSSLITTA